LTQSNTRLQEEVRELHVKVRNEFERGFLRGQAATNALAPPVQDAEQEVVIPDLGDSTGTD
jgi:hypothetical protein